VLDRAGATTGVVAGADRHVSAFRAAAVYGAPVQQRVDSVGTATVNRGLCASGTVRGSHSSGRPIVIDRSPLPRRPTTGSLRPACAGSTTPPRHDAGSNSETLAIVWNLVAQRRVGDVQTANSGPGRHPGSAQTTSVLVSGHNIYTHGCKVCIHVAAAPALLPTCIFSKQFARCLRTVRSVIPRVLATWSLVQPFATRATTSASRLVNGARRSGKNASRSCPRAIGG
jgi:hypothetical protein